MAKTAQEKLDAKREKEYNKKHKRMYKRSVGDVVFDVLNYIFFTVFTRNSSLSFTSLICHKTLVRLSLYTFLKSLSNVIICQSSSIKVLLLTPLYICLLYLICSGSYNTYSSSLRLVYFNKCDITYSANPSYPV